MDKKIFIKQILILEAAFRNFKISDNEMTLNVWYESLRDLDPGKMEFAVRTIIATSTFAPTIAEIRQKVTHEEMLDWSDGWAIVIKAIRKFGIYRAEEAHEFIKNIDYNTYETVLRLDYSKLCLSENEMADRANFRLAYENVENRRKRENALPKALQNPVVDMVEVITGKMNMNNRLSKGQGKVEALNAAEINN